MLRLIYIVVCVYLSCLPALAQKGQVIFFVDKSEEKVNADFINNYLPQLKAWATTAGYIPAVKDINDGAPAEVAFTPAIYFQNHKGRWLYVGRYNNVNKIKTFIRTVRRIPPEEMDTVPKQKVGWQKGRTKIIAEEKVTDFTGDLPNNFEQKEFLQEASQAFLNGLKSFQSGVETSGERTQRKVYYSIYPHLDRKTLYLSMEVYSQFNCVEPVYKQFDVPIKGKWKDRAALFAKAAEVYEREVEQLMLNTKTGDGFVPIASNVKTVSWESIGLTLPDAPEEEAVAIIIDWQKESPDGIWTISGSVEENAPMVSFSFLPPVDYYAGEIGVVKGGLTGTAKSLQNARGAFTVDLKRLTMGDPELDHSVHEMIMVKQLPQAILTFEKMQLVQGKEFDMSSTAQYRVPALLNFMGKETPINVFAAITPVLNDEGKVRLLVEASWDLRIDGNYDGLVKPDGPSPANDTIKFFVSFLMEAGSLKK